MTKVSNVDLSKSDVKAILVTLSILPSISVEGSTDAQENINYALCVSAGEKLIKRRSDLTSNEFRVILASLLAGQMINRGELEVDAETKKECSDHLFTINRLVSVFEKKLP